MNITIRNISGKKLRFHSKARSRMSPTVGLQQRKEEGRRLGTAFDPTNMKYKVTLNDRVYEVEVEKGVAMLLDEYTAEAPVPPAAAVPAAPAAAPVAAAAPAAAPVASIADGEPVTSPMPGTILSVSVAEGDTVHNGQLVAILEAMKMENEIFAPCDGKVLQIISPKGTIVDTGTTILVLG